MKILKRKTLAALLALSLLASILPLGAQPVLAATSLAIGDTVTFAGHDWYIIGTETEGVTAPEGCYTLFAKNNDFGATTFRASANRGDSTAYYYKDSDLQKKLAEIANGFSEEDRSNIQPRTLTVANDDIKGAEGDTVENQYLWPLSCAVGGTYHTNIIGGEMYEVPEALRAFDATYWTRTGYDGNGGEGLDGWVYFYDIIGVNQDGRPTSSSSAAGILGDQVATPVTDSLAIRPALYVQQEAVTMAPSFQLSASIINSISVGSDLVANDGTDTALTIDDGQQVNVKMDEHHTTQSGTKLAFLRLYSEGTTTGDNQVVACVLTDASGAVKYYGKLASCFGTLPETTELSVSIPGVANGTYTLSIFAHNTATGAISGPSPTMTLTVDSGKGTVSNYQGEIYSDSIVIEALSFSQHPADQTAYAGGGASFTAQATSGIDSNIKYTWQAQPKSSDPESDTWYDIYNYSEGEVVVSLPFYGQTLSLSNVSGSWQDNGYSLNGGSGFDPAEARFRCVAENNWDTVYSNPATLTMNDPVVTDVAVTPETAAMQQGSTLQFTATVSGEGSVDQSVSWSVSGHSSSATIISADGLLSVAADETASTLTVTATATSDGSKSASATVTVTAAPSAAEVKAIAGYGGSVDASTYTATANSGFVIDQLWLDGREITAASGQTSYTPSDTPSHSVFVTFAYTVDIDTPDNGSLSVSRNGAALTSGSAVHPGETLTITTAADEGYVLSSLSINDTDVTTENGATTYTVGSQPTATRQTGSATVAAAGAQISALFEKEAEPEPIMHTVTLDAEPSEGGSVSGGGEVAEGTVVTVTATANEGYTFTGWQENGSTVSTAASYTFTATADRSLVALFEKEEPDNPPEPVDPDEPDEPDNPPEPDNPSNPSEPADPSEPTTPEGPATDNSDGWTAIEDELDAASDGDTITVDMNGTTDVPAAVFETVAGKDVDETFELEGGVSWTVNGQDIPAGVSLSDLDLGVTLNSDGIPVDVINTIPGERDTVQMTLAHDGDFGFTMTLTAPLGAENAGYWANLYHYDEEAERLTFETAAEIDADGSVSLSLSHASQYAIVIDDHSHATIDLPFSDVSAGDWFYDPVVWIYNEGLMTGTSATTFEPNTSTTRAMIVAMLARLEGVTSAESAGFTDVSGSDWYATAVNWAASEGIVGGFGDGTFQPNAPITREQMASILYRYAEYKGLDVSARTDLSHYSDAENISSWANDVLSWAVAEGLLTGVTSDELQPQGNATRAQVAAILQRFLDN